MFEILQHNLHSFYHYLIYNWLQDPNLKELPYTNSPKYISKLLTHMILISDYDKKHSI